MAARRDWASGSGERWSHNRRRRSRAGGAKAGALGASTGRDGDASGTGAGRIFAYRIQAVRLPDGIRDQERELPGRADVDVARSLHA